MSFDRTVALVATAAVIATTGAVATPEPAAAAQYPSGCSWWTTGPDWSTNCWVGPTYDVYSNNVLGAQTAVKFYPIGCGGDTSWVDRALMARDGKYGDTTQAYIRIFQKALQTCYSVGVPDGIMGSVTWGYADGFVRGSGPIYSPGGAYKDYTASSAYLDYADWGDFPHPGFLFRTKNSGEHASAWWVDYSPAPTANWRKFTPLEVPPAT